MKLLILILVAAASACVNQTSREIQFCKQISSESKTTTYYCCSDFGSTIFLRRNGITTNRSLESSACDNVTLANSEENNGTSVTCFGHINLENGSSEYKMRTMIHDYIDSPTSTNSAVAVPATTYADGEQCGIRFTTNLTPNGENTSYTCCADMAPTIFFRIGTELVRNSVVSTPCDKAVLANTEGNSGIVVICFGQNVSRGTEDNIYCTSELIHHYSITPTPSSHPSTSTSSFFSTSSVSISSTFFTSVSISSTFFTSAEVGIPAETIGTASLIGITVAAPVMIILVFIFSGMCCCWRKKMFDRNGNLPMNQDKTTEREAAIVMPGDDSDGDKTTPDDKTAVEAEVNNSSMTAGHQEENVIAEMGRFMTRSNRVQSFSRIAEVCIPMEPPEELHSTPTRYFQAVENESTMELHQTQTPSMELPQTQAPSMELHQAQTPLMDSRQTQTPSIELHQTQTPSMELCQTQTPSMELHQTQTPSMESRQTQAPSMELCQTQIPSKLEIPLEIVTNDVTDQPSSPIQVLDTCILGGERLYKSDVADSSCSENETEAMKPCDLCQVQPKTQESSSPRVVSRSDSYPTEEENKDTMHRTLHVATNKTFERQCSKNKS